jgi:hypothetical protein
MAESAPRAEEQPRHRLRPRHHGGRVSHAAETATQLVIDGAAGAIFGRKNAAAHWWTDVSISS